MSVSLLRSFLLTGGPAAGKSTSARGLAEHTQRTVHLDVDDLRHLVVNGHAAPWDGREGEAQQLLGVRNAAAVAHNFLGGGFNVVMSDVLNAETFGLYRQLLPDVLIVRLVIDSESAWARARTRPMLLTDAEFETLHRQQRDPLPVDAEVDVSGLSIVAQRESLHRLWLGETGRVQS